MAAARAIKLLAVLALGAWTIQPLQAQASAEQATRATPVASTSATAITDGPSFLATILVGTTTAGTIKVFDLSAANCTGTPSNPLATITTVAAGTNPYSLIFNMAATNGICVQASVNTTLFTVFWNR